MIGPADVPRAARAPTTRQIREFIAAVEDVAETLDDTKNAAWSRNGRAGLSAMYAELAFKLVALSSRATSLDG